MLENQAFATAQTGHNAQAIDELQTLVEKLGPTPERLGLLGGRYKRQLADEWLRRTLLAVAFDAGDPDKAEELVDDVVADGPAKRKLNAVLGDLEASLALVNDAPRRARLSAVIDTLKTA